jgi:hypothetical protein
MVEGSRSIGMPTFDSTNGRLMEGNSGAAILERGGNNGCRANKPPHLLFWSVSCHYEELVPSVQKMDDDKSYCHAEGDLGYD